MARNGELLRGFWTVSRSRDRESISSTVFTITSWELVCFEIGSYVAVGLAQAFQTIYSSFDNSSVDWRKVRKMKMVVVPNLARQNLVKAANGIVIIEKQ